MGNNFSLQFCALVSNFQSCSSFWFQQVGGADLSSSLVDRTKTVASVMARPQLNGIVEDELGIRIRDFGRRKRLEMRN